MAHLREKAQQYRSRFPATAATPRGRERRTPHPSPGRTTFEPNTKTSKEAHTSCRVPKRTRNPTVQHSITDLSIALHIAHPRATPHFYRFAFFCTRLNGFDNRFACACACLRPCAHTSQVQCYVCCNRRHAPPPPTRCAPVSASVCAQRHTHTGIPCGTVTSARCCRPRGPPVLTQTPFA